MVVTACQVVSQVGDEFKTISTVVNKFYKLLTSQPVKVWFKLWQQVTSRRTDSVPLILLAPIFISAISPTFDGKCCTLAQLNTETC